MTDDWTRRAEREAAAVLDGALPGFLTSDRPGRDVILALLALAWIQGVNVGSHETLAAVEVGFEEMQARL